MQIQKLNWAGIRLELNGKIILIDAVEDFSYYYPVIGELIHEIIQFSEETKADYVLVTHLHIDHFDRKTIKKCLKSNGKLLVFTEIKEQVAKMFEGTHIIALSFNESFIENEIVFKSVFAMDGIGDRQCSWIIEGENVMIFHGGDTIWHNQFWRIYKENPGINYAFMPVNGVVVNFPMIGLEFSPIPATMNVKQAFAASKILHADFIIPIHYNLFADDNYYKPQVFTSEDLEKISEELHQKYIILNDGESLF